MSTLALIQILFNVVFILAVLVVWRKASRSSQEDPRLSRGLQLLQSKIAILEDLSDRTDQQVKTLSALLERRSQSLQEQMSEAEKHVSTIRKSMDQSLEVAKIFQDKIPHEEIIERKNTIKYVQAARLAHQGASVESIRNQVDLPDAELDFLVKMNRQGLMFSEEQLPSWVDASVKATELPGPSLGAVSTENPATSSRAAQASTQQVAPTSGGQSLTFNGSSTLEIPFSAPQEGSQIERRITESQLFKKASEVLGAASPVAPAAPAPSVPVAPEESKDTVRPFQFPRLDPFGNLG